MNEEKQQVGEKKTGGAWSDERKKEQKVQERKITYLYIAALLLQIMCLILQFVPFIEVAEDFEASLLGGIEFKKVHVTLMNNTQSMNSFFVFLNVVGILLLIISFISTIAYFIRKKNKMKSGFLLAKLAVIILLVSFVLGIKAWFGYAEELSLKIGEIVEVDTKELISTNYTVAVLYVVVEVALLIVLWCLSAIRKAKMQNGTFYL